MDPRINFKALSPMQRMQALRVYQNRAAQNAKDLEALVCSGVLLNLDKRHHEAVSYLKKAASLKKKDETILRNLADACSAALSYTDAKKYGRKLLELSPRNAEYHLFYGDVLEKMGDVSQAIPVWEKLNRIHPDNPKYLNRMAESFRKLGRNSDAEPIYQKIYEIDPHYAPTLYLFANSNRFESLEQAREVMEAINDAIPKTDDVILKANLHYSLGKIYNDLKMHDEAFEQWTMANQLKLPENPEEAYYPLTNARKAFDKPFYAARIGFGDPTDRPIFILGMPRSGTTLVESLCGAHSKITAGDEQSYMTHLNAALGARNKDPDAHVEAVHQVTSESALVKARHYLDSTRKIAGNTPHFTDKLPHNFRNMGLIRLIFPNAKIIHCRRHPIDNCLSLYSNSMITSHNLYKTDMKMLGLYYRQYWQLMQHWREVLPGGFYEVYYEDVVTNTELNARRMIDYLGLEWEDSVMDRQGSQKAVRTLSSWQVRQPVYTSSAGRWKPYEKHLAPLIDALGPVVGEYEAELAALSENAA